MVSKLTLGSLALLTSSTSVLAQTILTPFQNQTGPFFLRVTSADNETYDGSFLVACRTGNLVQGLCLGPDTVNNHTWHFFWNYTTVNDEPSKIGLLTWTLPILSNNALSISESMVLNFQPGSNVALPMFMPGPGTPVGWDNDTLYVPSRYDDTKFMPSLYPNSSVRDNEIHLKNWHACWVLWDAYYFNSLAWVSAGEPRNPTCEPVGLVKVDSNYTWSDLSPPHSADDSQADSESPKEEGPKDEDHHEDEQHKDEEEGEDESHEGSHEDEHQEEESPEVEN